MASFTGPRVSRDPSLGPLVGRYSAGFTSTPPLVTRTKEIPSKSVPIDMVSVGVFFSSVSVSAENGVRTSSLSLSGHLPRRAALPRFRLVGSSTSATPLALLGCALQRPQKP